jgi:hypothetical protein
VRRIRAIEQSGAPIEERNRMNRSRGGVMWGLVVGIVIVVVIVAAMIATPILERKERAASALPACDSAETQELVLSRVKRAIEAQNIFTDDVTVSDFETLRSEASTRLCQFLLNAQGQQVPFRAEMARVEGELRVRRLQKVPDSKP